MTDVKFNSISDSEMYQFTEEVMRRRVSCIAHRKSKANNKYMKSYGKDKSAKCIVNEDTNNLYEWKMSQYFPVGRFKWLKNVGKLDVNEASKDISKGYILEVDLEYPEELHDLHNEYPLAPEKTEIRESVYSDYCKEIGNKHNISVRGVKRILPSFCNKDKYVFHCRNLQLYLQLGMKLTKNSSIIGV